MIVEVCAGSLQDCLIAQRCGANRIELNSALFLGGLTPSVSVLTLAKKQVNIPIICMVRPRPAGFVYSDSDIQVMFHDAVHLLNNGADGIAFGFLTKDFQIDTKQTEKMINLIHSYGKEAVFHRAIDCVDDILSGVELLIQLGCDRILTSGTYNTALEGKEILQQLQTRYGNSIDILMGSGINSENIIDLQHYTNITQCHSTFKGWFDDNTTSTQKVSYRYGHLDAYDGVDENQLKKFIKVLERKYEKNFRLYNK